MSDLTARLGDPLSDRHLVENLVSLHRVVGEPDLEVAMEPGCLLVLVSEDEGDGAVVGGLVLTDTPSLPWRDAPWREMLSSALPDTRPADLSPLSTLFLRMFVSPSGAARPCLAAGLRELLSRLPDVRLVVTVAATRYLENLPNRQFYIFTGFTK